MDGPGIEEQVAATERSVIERVGRLALGDPRATVLPGVQVEHLRGIHNDARTEAIIKVIGSARLDSRLRGNEGDGALRQAQGAQGRLDSGPRGRGGLGAAEGTTRWSAVLKVVNQGGMDARNSWIDPALEARVYEMGLFLDPAVPFRAARCYGIDMRADGRKWLWLEDLTGAPQPPWTAQQFVDTAYRIGRFTGHHAVIGRPVGISLPERIFIKRWSAVEVLFRFPELYAQEGSAPVRAAYRGEAVRRALDLGAKVGRIQDAAARMPLALAHGDCHARNLFPLDDCTVAVDWSGLSMEPVGADLGVLTGSALTWSGDEAATVLGTWDKMFARYLTGLAESGFQADAAAVRKGFFAQFAIYLSAVLTLPGWIAAGSLGSLGPTLATRFGRPIEEVPESLAHMVPALLDLADEAVALAESD